VTYAEYSRAREAAGLDPALVASRCRLDVTTVSAWDSQAAAGQVLPDRHAATIRGFLHEALCDLLKNLCEDAFKKVPSEYVAIWLVVDQRECVLFPGACRNQDLVPFRVAAKENVEIRVRRDDQSLTAYPLFRSRKLLNLAGDAIKEHEEKKHRSRANAVFSGGICESLLHVPAFYNGESNSAPVLLLSLENKLDKKQVIVRTGGDRTPVYSEADEVLAGKLAMEFEARLRPLLALPGILTPKRAEA